MYVQKKTKALSVENCRDLKQSCTHARDTKHPLNTLVTFAPYPGSLPAPVARSIDLNRLLTYLRMWTHRHLGEPLVAIWVWHSDVRGRNPHVHVFMHCPKPHRDRLRQALVARHPPRVIDVSKGSDIREPHYSGYYSSTLDYLCRFKSQQAFVADGGKTWRASIKDENGRHRGIPSPITGKRWGCTRNIAARAIDFHLATKAEARAAAISATRKAA